MTWLDDQNRKRLYRVNSRQVNNVTKIQKQREETAIITWMLMIQPGTIPQTSFRVVLELYVLYIRRNQWKCYSRGEFYTIYFYWHKCFSICLSFFCIRKLCIQKLKITRKYLKSGVEREREPTTFHMLQITKKSTWFLEASL